MAHKLTIDLPVSGHYGTHLPALMRALQRSVGPVLELGMGFFSTGFLHYACMLQNRRLVSYENNAKWADFFLAYDYPKSGHEIRVVKDWADADVQLEPGPLWSKWSVVLIDHSPDEWRTKHIAQLAQSAYYVVIHDSNGKHERTYHYSTIYPLFRYRTDWTREARHAAVLSNFVDLGDFWK
jgi:hypothetical protein